MNFYEEDSLYYIYHEVDKLKFKRIQKLLSEIGLYAGQPHLLFALYEKDGQSQKELATKLNVRASTITMMSKRMEKMEFLIRKQDENDQRISRVYITEKGKEICGKLKGFAKVIDEECFKNFTSEERIIFRRLLIQVRDNLREDDE